MTQAMNAQIACRTWFALLLIGGTSWGAAEWQFDHWEVLRSSTSAVKRPAPIRNIVRAANGTLLGTRSTGSSIQLFRSTNSGVDWSLYSTVAQSGTVEYGDPTLYVLSSGEVLAGFRELHPAFGWSVRVSRSVNNGLNWSFGGTIEDWTNTSDEFVGAPQFLQLDNGTLQVYYDSELAAPGGNQYIAVKTGTYSSGTSLWNWQDQRVVNDSGVGAAGVRDGLATVVDLGPDLDGSGQRIMVVTEGIGITNGRAHNNIRAFQVQNSGATQSDWDTLLDSRVIYQSPLLDPQNHRYNAYAPYALRVGDGPVVVAFSTDEVLDQFNDTADSASAPVVLRHSEIKLIHSTSNFETWSDPVTVWGIDHVNFNGTYDSGDIFNYQIGMIELAPNDLLATLDMFGGNQIVFRPSLRLAGDYNSDNVVDLADYTIWRDAQGSTVSLAADGSNNGVVDAQDYQVWQSNFGASRSATLAATEVPEPTAWLLALLSALAVAPQRWRARLSQFRVNLFSWPKCVPRAAQPRRENSESSLEGHSLTPRPSSNFSADVAGSVGFYTSRGVTGGADFFCFWHFGGDF